ncbi:hypothetical protein ACFL4G_05595 [Thermodesulfobacteriota bacterium]
MAQKMTLRIITPNRMVFDGQCDEITVPGPKGEIGLLPDHANYFSALGIGRLSFVTEGGIRNLTTVGGYVHVADNAVTILTDSADDSGEGA